MKLGIRVENKFYNQFILDTVIYYSMYLITPKYIRYETYGGTQGFLYSNNVCVIPNYESI